MKKAGLRQLPVPRDASQNLEDFRLSGRSVLSPTSARVILKNMKKNAQIGRSGF